MNIFRHCHPVASLKRLGFTPDRMVYRESSDYTDEGLANLVTNGIPDAVEKGANYPLGVAEGLVSPEDGALGQVTKSTRQLIQGVLKGVTRPVKRLVWEDALAGPRALVRRTWEGVRGVTWDTIRPASKGKRWEAFRAGLISIGLALPSGVVHQVKGTLNLVPDTPVTVMQSVSDIAGVGLDSNGNMALKDYGIATATGTLASGVGKVVSAPIPETTKSWDPTSWRFDTGVSRRDPGEGWSLKKSILG
jgi:hypothetical protein